MFVAVRCLLLTLLAIGPSSVQATLLFDSDLVELTGTWTTEQASFYVGGSALVGVSPLAFTATIPLNGLTGEHEIFVSYPVSVTNAPGVTLTVTSEKGIVPVTLNMQQNDGEGGWVSLGTYTFGTAVAGSVQFVVLGTAGRVIVDAVKAESISSQTASPSMSSTSSGSITRSVSLTSSISLSPSRTPTISVSPIPPSPTPSLDTGLIVDSQGVSSIQIGGTWTVLQDERAYGGSHLMSGPLSIFINYIIPIPAGRYHIFIWYIDGPDYSPSVSVTVNWAGGTTLIVLDMTQNGGQWVSLGEYEFDGIFSGIVSIRAHGSSALISADAVRAARSPESPSHSRTPTRSPTVSVTSSRSLTASRSGTISITPTSTPSPMTPSLSSSISKSTSRTASFSMTSSLTSSQSLTATVSSSRSATISISNSWSRSVTASSSTSPSPSPDVFLDSNSNSELVTVVGNWQNIVSDEAVGGNYKLSFSEGYVAFHLPVPTGEYHILISYVADASYASSAEVELRLGGRVTRRFIDMTSRDSQYLSLGLHELIYGETNEVVIQGQASPNHVVADSLQALRIVSASPTPSTTAASTGFITVECVLGGLAFAQFDQSQVQKVFISGVSRSCEETDLCTCHLCSYPVAVGINESDLHIIQYSDESSKQDSTAVEFVVTVRQGVLTAVATLLGDSDSYSPLEDEFESFGLPLSHISVRNVDTSRAFVPTASRSISPTQSPAQSASPLASASPTKSLATIPSSGMTSSSVATTPSTSHIATPSPQTINAAEGGGGGIDITIIAVITAAAVIALLALFVFYRRSRRKGATLAVVNSPSDEYGMKRTFTSPNSAKEAQAFEEMRRTTTPQTRAEVSHEHARRFGRPIPVRTKSGNQHSPSYFSDHASQMSDSEIANLDAAYLRTASTNSLHVANASLDSEMMIHSRIAKMRAVANTLTPAQMASSQQYGFQPFQQKARPGFSRSDTVPHYHSYNETQVVGKVLPQSVVGHRLDSSAEFTRSSPVHNTDSTPPQRRSQTSAALNRLQRQQSLGLMPTSTPENRVSVSTPVSGNRASPSPTSPVVPENRMDSPAHTNRLDRVPENRVPPSRGREGSFEQSPQRMSSGRFSPARNSIGSSPNRMQLSRDFSPGPHRADVVSPQRSSLGHSPSRVVSHSSPARQSPAQISVGPGDQLPPALVLNNPNHVPLGTTSFYNH